MNKIYYTLIILFTCISSACHSNTTSADVVKSKVLYQAYRNIEDGAGYKRYPCKVEYMYEAPSDEDSGLRSRFTDELRLAITEVYERHGMSLAHGEVKRIESHSIKNEMNAAKAVIDKRFINYP